MAVTLDDKHKLLKKYWGYSEFRPMQEAIIDSLLSGHDTLALLPTGGGKSLCYQLPALMFDGLCLVVSPLVALMKDQVRQLTSRKMKAACLSSGLTPNQAKAVLYNAMAGDLKYLYVSPERLCQRMFIEHFRRMKVSIIAVDEAHCISQWGYDFRPPYLRVAEIRAYHPNAPLIALTATATCQVVDDIKERLNMRNCRVFRTSFERSNLAYTVVNDGNKIRRLQSVLSRYEESAIVYVRSRRMSQAIAQQLQAMGIAAQYYHAGLDAAERDRRQHMWMQGECRVMVATNAFGMGIDKPDVRVVVHIDIPDSIEAYFQEAGRAGRDGKPSLALLIYDDSDIAKCQRDFAVDYPPVKYIRNAYRALCNYYKLPIGGGAEAFFDFQLEEICNTYGFRPREFFRACHLLENEGVIAMPDVEDSVSELYIPLQRDELYRFQVDHLAMGNLLQAIIRIYPGLFTEPVQIREELIAQRCLMEAKDVTAMLNKMKSMHVVEYRAKTTVPQIVFTSPRVEESQLAFTDSGYEHIKQSAHARMEAMLSYVTDNSHCRSRRLLAYFDQADGVDCGLCDVCVHRQATTPDSLQDAVRALLGRNRMTVAETIQLLERQGYTNIDSDLRRLLDRGELALDADMRLYCLN